MLLFSLIITPLLGTIVVASSGSYKNSELFTKSEGIGSASS